MAATDFQYTRIPLGTDVSVKNTSGGTLNAGEVVKLDTANLESGTQGDPGVVACSAVTDYPYGVLAENIPSNGQGRCQLGGIAVCIAAGAITAGNIVGPSATAGDVTTYTAGDPSLGQALDAAASAGDPIRVRISISKNA